MTTKDTNGDNTRALGSLGVYGRPDLELSILALSDEYREGLCQLWHARHVRLVDLRDELFPELWSAMVAWESTKAKIYQLEKQIKAYHSDVRDRNAVTAEDRTSLKELREQAKTLGADVRQRRKDWYAVAKRFREHWRTLADWKNVKSRADREERYAAISQADDWPDEAVRRYATVWMESDLAMRRLSAESQEQGLHSAIRGEIVDASKPKTSRTSPGMRYQCHRRPDPRPWEKLTLQFPGGLTIEDAVNGKHAGLQLTPLYTQHKARREHTVYEVRQQIGTQSHPLEITYHMKAHRELRGVIQRWTLVVRESGKRIVVPILKDHGLVKPQGKGTFGVDLSWRVVKDGLLVARFVGDHVNESLILPSWLVSRRMCLPDVQAASDAACNEYLGRVGHLPRAGRRQGLAALQSYVAGNPDDPAARNLLDLHERRVELAQGRMAQAKRCIESIYKTVAHRVCKLHDCYVPDTLDLSNIKRYDTRDLLKVDKLPRPSREYLQAAAPGKLAALLKGWGLASGEATPELPPDARETDLFTSYVASLGRKTGPKQDRQTSRSHHVSREAVVQ